jgi:RNA recognition motif-containing protein
MDGQLQVRNLARTATEDDLWTLFMQAGDVLGVRIPRDRLSRESRGYAFVTMSALSEADKAVSRLNEHLFHGLKLKVSLAQARTVRGGSMG